MDSRKRNKEENETCLGLFVWKCVMPSACGQRINNGFILLAHKSTLMVSSRLLSSASMFCHNGVYICSGISYHKHFASCEFCYFKQSVLIYIISEILSFRWTFPIWGLEIVQRSLRHTLIHFVLFFNRAQMGWGGWWVARGRRWEREKNLPVFS